MGGSGWLRCDNKGRRRREEGSGLILGWRPPSPELAPSFRFMVLENGDGDGDGMGMAQVSEIREGMGGEERRVGLKHLRALRVDLEMDW